MVIPILSVGRLRAIDPSKEYRTYALSLYLMLDRGAAGGS